MENNDVSKKQIVPFGKYKGQPVSILKSDPKYVDWILSQSWFGDSYPEIRTLIINNFQEPTETPEHNKLAARFLDKNLCLRLIGRLYKDRVNNSDSRMYQLGVENIEIDFEVHTGMDVYIKIKIPDEHGELYILHSIGIEIKPCISDDFPSVVRQIRANNRCYRTSYNGRKFETELSDKLVVAFEDFNAKGATLEQCQSMFSDILFICVDDI